jgi:hypothetical protein
MAHEKPMREGSTEMRCLPRSALACGKPPCVECLIRAFALLLALCGGVLGLLSPAQAQFSANGQFALPSTGAAAPTTTLLLSAAIEGSQTVLRKGLVWKIYDAPADRRAKLMSSSTEANPRFDLAPGAYIIHVSYGLASASRRIVLAQQAVSERIGIAAGGLSLSARVSDMPIPEDRVNFSIYVALGNNPEGRLVAHHVPPNRILHLPIGNYRIISRYGSTNAVATADLRIDSGILSQAVITHRAATVVLKLVREPGTEALAGTRFSVLTPGGDIVREMSGAFPSMTLAEGDYVVVARNGGKIYTADVTIKSGEDRDVEVMAINPLAQD